MCECKKMTNIRYDEGPIVSIVKLLSLVKIVGPVKLVSPVKIVN